MSPVPIMGTCFPLSGTSCAHFYLHAVSTDDLVDPCTEVFGFGKFSAISIGLWSLEVYLFVLRESHSGWYQLILSQYRCESITRPPNVVILVYVKNKGQWGFWRLWGKSCISYPALNLLFPFSVVWMGLDLDLGRGRFYPAVNSPGSSSSHLPGNTFSPFGPKFLL